MAEQQAPRKKRSALDLPLPRGPSSSSSSGGGGSSSPPASLSAFSFLFSEMVQYCAARVDVTQELEARLSALGYPVGQRALDLLSLREKAMRKERGVKAVLQFLRSSVWRALFGRQADRLEKSTANADEFYIYDDSPITNMFVSVPKDFGQLNCAAFMGGVIAGVLDAAEFPASVTAHEHEIAPADGDADGAPPRTTTVFIIKFEPEVVERERDLQSAA